MIRDATCVVRFTLEGFLPEEYPSREVSRVLTGIAEKVSTGRLDGNIRDAKGKLLGAYYVTIKGEEEEEKWETEPGSK